MSREVDELKNTLRSIRCYVEGWERANEVTWPEGTLGADDKARNNMWLAVLHNMLEACGPWIEEPIVFLDGDDEGE